MGFQFELIGEGISASSIKLIAFYSIVYSLGFSWSFHFLAFLEYLPWVFFFSLLQCHEETAYCSVWDLFVRYRLFLAFVLNNSTGIIEFLWKSMCHWRSLTHRTHKSRYEQFCGILQLLCRFSFKYFFLSVNRITAYRFNPPPSHSYAAISRFLDVDAHLFIAMHK